MPEITIDFSQVGAADLTEEMARFLARANCLDAIPGLLHDEHGTPPHVGLAAATARLQKAKARRTLSSRAKRLLRISWQTELAARFALAFDEPALKRIGAQTLPVNAYYAFFNAQRALADARGTKTDQHRAVADSFAGHAKRWPMPWCMTLAGDPGIVSSCVITPPVIQPYAFSPLERSHDDLAYIWAALRMTRRWKVELARNDWFRQRANRKPDGSIRKRLPAGVKAKLATDLRPTTLHDFMWELRRRANYESADEYGADVSAIDFERFHDGLVALLDSGMQVIEAGIALNVGPGELSTLADEWMHGARRVGSWATDPLRLRMSAVKATLGG